MRPITGLVEEMNWWGGSFGIQIKNHKIERIAAVSDKFTGKKSLFDFIAHELHTRGSNELDRLFEGKSHTVIILLCAEEIKRDNRAISTYVEIVLGRKAADRFNYTGSARYVINILGESRNFEDMKNRLYSVGTKKYINMAHDAYIKTTEVKNNVVL